MNERTIELDINTSKMVKVEISHELMEQLLELPEDTIITSMHTTRGEDYTGIYMASNRFDVIPPGAVTPEMSLDNVKTIGLWDDESN